MNNETYALRVASRGVHVAHVLLVVTDQFAGILILFFLENFNSFFLYKENKEWKYEDNYGKKQRNEKKKTNTGDEHW